MLPRVLEPEVMDTPEEARDYDAMDHSGVNDLFVRDFLAAHGPCQGGQVLDVGTGTAQIPIRLCQLDPSARVLAIDLAQQMLRVGRDNVLREGLADRIELKLIDAKHPDLPPRTYEAVISNSIVHHIPEPLTVFEAMVRLLAPGGTLFVRDLARPASQEELDRLVELYAGAESAHARRMFAESLHAALTVPEVRALVAELGFEPSSVRITSDRHWTWIAQGQP